MTMNPEGFTQRNFNDLPVLLTRKQLKQWTGLHDQDVRRMVAAGELTTFRPNGAKYAKYYKSEVARLCKLNL